MKRSVFAFVILHYLDCEITKQCVESIIETLESENYYIVIVDNASPNDSGKELQKSYKNNDKINIIMRTENDGFAKGNNVGYQYAKKQLKADFIICINNDTLIEQKEFLHKIEEMYNKTKCGVLGPDIITRDEKKQNPRRTKRLTYSQIRKIIIRKRILLLYFYWKKYFFSIPFIEHLIEMADIKPNELSNMNEIQEDVVLLGACIIYCPIFIVNERNAFSPKTFMYGEEDLLAWYCYKKGYKTVYYPDIQIIHLSGISTKRSTRSEVDKDIFVYKYIIEGLKLLKDEMK